MIPRGSPEKSRRPHSSRRRGRPSGASARLRRARPRRPVSGAEPGVSWSRPGGTRPRVCWTSVPDRHALEEMLETPDHDHGPIDGLVQRRTPPNLADRIDPGAGRQSLFEHRPIRSQSPEGPASLGEHPLDLHPLPGSGRLAGRRSIVDHGQTKSRETAIRRRVRIRPHAGDHAHRRPPLQPRPTRWMGARIGSRIGAGAGSQLIEAPDRSPASRGRSDRCRS